MSADKVQVIEPRAVSERLQIGRAHARLIELTIPAIERLERIIQDPDADLKDVKWAIKQVLDHTIAPVQRIDIMALIARLQPAEDPALKSAEVRDERALLREALRRVAHGEQKVNGYAH